MNPLDQLRADLAYVEDCLTEIHTRNADKALEGDDATAFDAGKAYVVATRAAIKDIEDRNKVFDTADRNKVPGADQPTFHINRNTKPVDVLEDRDATPSQLADAVTRALEPLVDDADGLAAARKIMRRHSADRPWARNLLARTTDVYQEAWLKAVTGREIFLSNEERTALSVGSNTNGGFLVPTHLDPTIILTNSGVSNVIRGMSRQITLTEGNVWNGVNSAGVTSSWDGELVEVSDDSPTFGRVQIPLYMAQTFVQASVASFEDISSLTSDVLMLFADAKDRLEAVAHATGNGTSAPKGIFTALDANTNCELTSTTAATVGLVDLNAQYIAVPVRWRSKSSWLMNPLYSTAIRALGNAVSASFSGDLRDAPGGMLLGRPMVESDEAPTTQTTTVRDNEIVLGDFSQFAVVDKPGSTGIDFIPHLFNTANNLPDGRRGWYMHWRNGSDALNPLAFRLLQDKTSA